MKKHVFFTGDKQIGKSTLIEKIIQGREEELCGFQTRPFLIENEKKRLCFLPI